MLPMVELTIFALGILLIDLMVPRSWKWINAAGALVGVLFAGLCVWQIQAMLPPRGLVGFYNSLLVDRFAIYFWYLFLAGTAISILTSVHYLEIEDEHHGEYYALLLLSVVGMMCMAAGIDVVLIFIGLELMAISSYVLVGFLRRDRRSNEAALKYLLLGAFSSGIFAYGLSLFYGISGSTNLGVIGRAVSGQNTHNPVVIIALLTTMVGLLFKIAAIPFHQWAPDAYEGAPTSITGFMSVAVKAAAWAMLLRILLFGLFPLRSVYTPVIVFVSIATMTGANFAALTQSNTKRLLAYSSIAHVGYMLLAFVAMGTSPLGTPGFLDGFKGILIYLMVYTFMNLGAFAVITSLRQRNVIGDELDDIFAFARRHSARSGFSRQVLYLSQSDRKPTLRLGRAGRCLFALRTLLLPQDCELDADACADGEGATACQFWDALRGGDHGAGHSVHWNLSGAGDSQRELVTRDSATCAGSCNQEVGCELTRQS